ncbi:hypothetical protein LCGC14_0550270 [marine sediment metagenome]|uniref:Uncharacterized protein n=1 Tax=marine sediment metagenome TaxID=412755 RepID=A0A0F9UYC0_9ZZZZ
MATTGEINLDSANTMEFTVSVGDLIKLCSPPTYLPIPFTSKQSDREQYRNGFIILKPDLGKFEGASGNSCVKYRHTKSGRQVIQYTSQKLGEKHFYAIVSGITIHDHASVAQGGPAFATYFADVPSEQTEEGG